MRLYDYLRRVNSCEALQVFVGIVSLRRIRRQSDQPQTEKHSWFKRIKADAIKVASPAFVEMRSLAMRFRALFRTGDPEKLDPWLEAAMATGLKVIMRFAGRMRRDQKAVENAIALPWSNGQAEGQIARLKMVKRSMYGRAGIALLKARLV